MGPLYERNELYHLISPKLSLQTSVLTLIWDLNPNVALIKYILIVTPRRSSIALERSEDGSFRITALPGTLRTGSTNRLYLIALQFPASASLTITTSINDHFNTTRQFLPARKRTHRFPSLEINEEEIEARGY